AGREYATRPSAFSYLRGIARETGVAANLHHSAPNPFTNGTEETRMNAIQLLTQEHKKVRQLLKELEDTTTRNKRDRERLAQEISNEVTIHAQIEEEIFYPAFKAAAEKEEDTEMFFEAAEEHHVVEVVMPELLSTDPSTPEFSAK